jgi:putative ABC transport system permease protein
VFDRISYSLRSLLLKDKVESEMDRELRFHLEMQIEENVRRGMSRADARSEALRSFGGVEQTKEECRDISWVRLLDTLWQDLRYGLRILRKNPGFTTAAILTLALGIGANTAIFSVIHGVLVRPLPYKDGERLVVLHQQAAATGDDEMQFSAKEILDYREQSETLDAVVEHHSMAFILLGRNEPQRVQTGVVSANFFEVLGVEPLFGRTFVPEDDGHGSEAVLVLSFKYWRESQGGDPNILGSVFQMNNRPHTVIGVLPPIPQYPVESDVYMPTSHCPTRSSDRFIANRTARMMNAFGRLKPGVSVENAQADLSRIADNLRNQYPEAYPEAGGYQAGLAPLSEELTRRAKPTFLILLGTAGLVLLIACANVANLTLARLLRREREMAIRSAMGAGRVRLIRQLLTESTLLALAGGALGLIFAAGGLQLLKAFAARFTTRADEISIDGSVLLFTLLVSIATGCAFGLMPVFSSNKNAIAALKEGAGRSTAGAGRQRIRSLLIVAQVAVSFVLLIGAGLMLRSLMKLQSVDPGFNPENVLAMRINLNWSKYDSDQKLRRFYQQLLEKVEVKPGVSSAAVASSYPLNQLAITFGPFKRDYELEGSPIQNGEPAPQTAYRSTTPSYFQTLRMPMMSGRAFTASDSETAPPVAIINSSFARRRFSNEDPIGKRLSFDRGESWLTIVGVVGDAKEYGLDRDPGDEVYVPFSQDPGGGNLLVRTFAGPESLIRVMRDSVYEVDPETAIDRVQTLKRVRSESIASPRLTAILLGLFAILALVITATGIAGVMNLAVSQRTHEIGVRLALGATPGQVLGMVMRQGMQLVGAGLVIGAIVALALAGVLSTLLFGVEPTDPLTFLAVALLLIGAAGWACFVPARRVIAIDPIAALKSE